MTCDRKSLKLLLTICKKYVLHCNSLTNLTAREDISRRKKLRQIVYCLFNINGFFCCLFFWVFFNLGLNLFLFWYRNKKYLKLLNCIQEEGCLGEKNTKLDDILNHLEKACFFFF